MLNCAYTEQLPKFNWAVNVYRRHLSLAVIRVKDMNEHSNHKYLINIIMTSKNILNRRLHAAKTFNTVNKETLVGANLSKYSAPAHSNLSCGDPNFTIHGCAL
jgi:hypothetical protein